MTQDLYADVSDLGNCGSDNLRFSFASLTLTPGTALEADVLVKPKFLKINWTCRASDSILTYLRPFA